MSFIWVMFVCVCVSLPWVCLCTLLLEDSPAFTCRPEECVREVKHTLTHTYTHIDYDFPPPGLAVCEKIHCGKTVGFGLWMNVRLCWVFSRIGPPVWPWGLVPIRRRKQRATLKHAGNKVWTLHTQTHTRSLLPMRITSQDPSRQSWQTVWHLSKAALTHFTILSLGFIISFQLKSLFIEGLKIYLSKAQSVCNPRTEVYPRCSVFLCFLSFGHVDNDQIQMSVHSSLRGQGSRFIHYPSSWDPRNRARLSSQSLSERDNESPACVYSLINHSNYFNGVFLTVPEYLLIPQTCFSPLCGRENSECLVWQLQGVELAFLCVMKVLVKLRRR